MNKNRARLYWEQYEIQDKTPQKSVSDTNFVSQPNLDNDLRQTITLVLQALSKSNFVSSIKHNFKNKLDDFILYLNFDRDTKLDLEKACQTRVTVCVLVMIQIMLWHGYAIRRCHLNIFNIYTPKITSHNLLFGVEGWTMPCVENIGAARPLDHLVVEAFAKMLWTN